ncbi:hypothetical protein SOVF_033680 [Spinacia oleracea]|nr:hypothetical protein SOVF_033680 [Spinacia oleracea]
MNSTHETPDFIRMYLCLDKPYYDNGRVPFFDDIGIGFTVGSIGGSFYHFLKAAVCTKTIPINSRFSAGINAARAHAPRLGAFWVLFTIATNLSSAATVGFLGEQANRWIE